MSDSTGLIYLISFFTFISVVSLINAVYFTLTAKRQLIMQRLRGSYQPQFEDDGDIMNKPFLERAIGTLAQRLVKRISLGTPKRMRISIEQKLEKAGNPQNITASDFLAVQGIAALTVLIISWYGLSRLNIPFIKWIPLVLFLFLLVLYLPWFILARLATVRKRAIQMSLADVIDLLVISIEAGLAFDMALLKVVDKYKGIVGREFQRVLREMQMGSPRKDALKGLSQRVDLEELTALVNAIIQSDQLGVGLGQVLRLQADIIREKRQSMIEEQAMKAPVKMLFPLIFLIFPSIFIILLGPALLNILKVLGGR